MSIPTWWGDWRPTLAPHVGNLQPTDLLECTSIVGGLPVNNAITGAQIIAAASGGATWGGITGTLSSQTDLQTALNAKQDTLVSGTNIKTINSTSLLGSGNITVASSPYTSIGSTANGALVASTTANTIGASIQIPANTLTVFDTIQLRAIILKATGAGTTNVRIYLNTTNSLTGATLIGSAANMTGSQQGQRVYRDFWISASALWAYLPTNPLSSDITNGAVSNFAYTVSTSYFIIIALQHSTTSESAQVQRYTLMKY